VPELRAYEIARRMTVDLLEAPKLVLGPDCIPFAVDWSIGKCYGKTGMVEFNPFEETTVAA
jgi:hypothetical protein